MISLNSEHAVLAAMHLQTRTHFEGDPSLLLPLISAAFAWSFERPCRFLAIHPCGVRATGSAASFKDGDGVLSQPDMPGQINPTCRAKSALAEYAFTGSEWQMNQNNML